MELVTDTIKGGLQRGEPENGHRTQELGAPTVRGKAPGGPMEPSCRAKQAAEGDLANHITTAEPRFWGALFDRHTLKVEFDIDNIILPV
jgi:hypothetical protein